MDIPIRKAQERVLDLFSKEAKTFALAGGTALELFYLNHRFSWDLDFFSPRYDIAEIDKLISLIQKKMDKRCRLESELTAGGQAKVRFYTLPVKGSSRPLKIDFVEDVLIKKPTIKTKKGVRVYGVGQIYLQKIVAISGVRPAMDETGRPFLQGRNEARDVFDLFRLSSEIKPLHQFLKKVPTPWQKGLIHWYRTYSRHDLKLDLLDLEIYDKKFNSRDLIDHLEKEIRLFTRGLVDQ